jgi:hypothetical protein
MANPCTDFQVCLARLCSAGVGTAYREKNRPMKMMIGSVIFFVVGVFIAAGIPEATPQ